MSFVAFVFVRKKEKQVKMFFIVQHIENVIHPDPDSKSR